MSSTPLISEALRPPRLGPTSGELTDRGRELLDAIEQIIVEEGFASLTVGDLAARLKCSRSTLYSLAPSKDELVLVVVDRRLRRIGRIKRQRLDELTDPAEKLQMVIASEHLHVQRTSLRFSEDVARTPAVQRLIADHLRYGVAQLRDVIEEGIAAGRFRLVHSRIVAEVIDVGLERIQRPEVLRETGLEFDAAATELIELLLSGLVADGAAAARSPGRNRKRR
jgi:AcrR family transcriptional regulator